MLFEAFRVMYTVQELDPRAQVSKHDLDVTQSKTESYKDLCRIFLDWLLVT